MRLPHRSIKSIQPLPSIYTAFPISYDNTQSSIDSAINSGTCLIRQIEDGIEVVPFERCNQTSAPILSPDQGEKEVLIISQTEKDVAEKPLPSLPRCVWQRMSLRQRILGLLGLQFILLTTIGLSLLAAKYRPSQQYALYCLIKDDTNISRSDQSSEVRAAGTDSPSTGTLHPIRRGMFAVPVQLPQQQSSACLAFMNESVAWQCASDTTFQLNILPSPINDSDATIITLGIPPGNTKITHGHQVPNLRPTELSLLPADTDDGPTYHFRTTYDRTVLLKESDLDSAGKSQTQPLIRHPTFDAGESVWRCVFNETLIEGYIYVDQPTTAEPSSTGSGSNATTAVSLPKVPYVMKLVEQRMPNGKGPYCEKLTVQGDGNLSPPSDKVFLNLSAPASEPRLRTGILKSARFRARRQVQSANYCRCQWLIQ